MAGDAELDPLRRASAQTMQQLVDSIRAHAYGPKGIDASTQGHSRAVAWLAMQIAKQAGLSPAEIEEIGLAGLVHDIGKIHVPQQVLRKPPPLTAEEFEIIKSHAALGAEILQPFNLKAIECIVRHHHERYDGKGYPDGLAGDKIPLGARIVAVAECYHRIVSDPRHQGTQTFEDAIAELRRCSGTQFDPKIVTAFLNWLETRGDRPEQQGRCHPRKV